MYRVDAKKPAIHLMAHQLALNKTTFNFHQYEVCSCFF